MIGFDDDLFIPAWSAVAQDSANRFGHSVVYWGDQFLPKIDAHMLPLWRTSGNYRAQFCDYFGGCNMADRGTWSELSGAYNPIKMARYGNYYLSLW